MHNAIITSLSQQQTNIIGAGNSHNLNKVNYFFLSVYAPFVFQRNSYLRSLCGIEMFFIFLGSHSKWAKSGNISISSGRENTAARNRENDSLKLKLDWLHVNECSNRLEWIYSCHSILTRCCSLLLILSQNIPVMMHE